MLDSSNLKEFADNNFKFLENGKGLCERIEKTGGKGEIARYKQFLLFPTVFLKDLYCKHIKTLGLVWKKAQPFPNDKF